MSTAATLPDKIKEIRATLQEKLKTVPDFGFGIRDKITQIGRGTTSSQTQNGILSKFGQPIRQIFQGRIGQTGLAGQGGLIKSLGQGKFLQSFQGKRILQAPTPPLSGHITDIRRTKGPAAGAAVESENYPSSNEIAIEL